MNNQFNAQEGARNIKTLPPSCQKLTTGMQQRWNRAIPESDYIQLGTLRYGVRLSNPNLANAATANDDNNGIPLANSRNTQQSRISSDSYDQHTNGSSVLSAGGTSSNSSRGVNDSCCCIGSNGIEMPWSGGYVRTRLPVPSNYAKNRKSSPSTSTSSSSSSTTHRQLHQAPQKQTATQQGSREKLQHSTNNGTDLLNNCSNNNNNGSSTFAGVDKHNQQRESSPASVSGVCCYTSNNFSSASNKNAKNNNLVKVSNKYSDSKKLKIVNNKGEHKDTVPSSYDEENRTSGNHRNGFGYGSNSRNLSEKWSSGISGEYDAVTSSVQKHGDFPSSEIISAKEPLGRGSEVSVKKNDGDDLNLNFRNAQPQSKEPRLKDVNINNFKKRNTSTYGVYFGPNSSVGRTGINNKNNIGKNTTTRGDDICTDELSSSSSLSPRSPPSPLPLPPPPTVVAESWMFNDRVKQTPPCSPIPTSCSGSFNKISSPFETTARSESSPFDFSPPGTPQHTRVRAFSDSNGCSAENNQCRINRPAVQHHNKLTTKNHTIPPSENERAYDQRKSSLPVINHASVVRSQPYRKFSSDIISAKANGPPSSVVICQLTPKLASRGSNAEVRLQSLSRYCAQNLSSNPISDSPAVAESEDFTFIDSSDISSTGDDVITVINEEDYREYHKYLSIPKLDGSSDGLCPSGYDSCQNSNSNYGYGCSSDELSSVCSGSDSVPTLVVNNFKEEAKRNFHTVKYKQCNVSLQSSARASEENHPGSSCPGPSSPVDSEQKSPTAVSGQSDSNNNQHMRNTEDELKFNPSNNSHERNEDRLSGVAAASESVGQNSTHRLGFNSISPDSSSSSLNCFGKHQLHVRSSPEKPIMEKKNYALDRLQKLVKKTTSGSSEGKTSDKQGGTKTERLRELTELLKGTRNPPVPPPRRPKASQSLDKTFERQNTTSLTSASLLNIDTLRGENNSSNLVKSKESRSIDFPYQFVEGNRASTPSSPRSEHKANLRANVSTSNLESLQSSPTKENNVSVVEIPSTDFKEDDDIFTKLSRPESRTIVGSYTQKTIPFRSASFSQVDYSSGKYIRSALGAIKNSLMRGKEGSAVDSVTLPRNKKEFTRSCSPAQLSSASDPCGSFEENVTSKGSLKKSELSINLSPPDGFERIEGFDGKELSSNRNSDIETIVEDPEAEHSETIENENSIQKKAEINAVQASEMILEPLVEEGIPITPQSLAKDEECLQQATTCLIPVPVYDCVVSEWSTARPSEQWIDASMTECTKLTECLDSIIESSENASEPSEVHLNPVEAIVIDSPPDVLEVEMSKLGTVDETAEQFVELALNSTITSNQFENGEMCTPPVSIICTEPDSEVSTTIIETPPTPEEALIRVESVEGEVVEVRKRHSNNEDSGEAISNCNSEMEEKRRIDKSKRRKGIYIQWPAIDTNLDPESDSNDNCTPDDSWRPSRLTIEKDSSIDLSGESCTDLSSKDITSSPEKLRDSSIYHGPDPFLLGPNTPDSDISRPEWPRGLRRKSLTYQSSDEKDDSAPISSIPVRSFKNIFLRSDSVSDNESERASSRDRTSASPAPSSEHDLRRYSKRPLRGPYGQMLEAEMKKPSKVHYNEILEELARHESSHSFPSASRNRGSGSQSMDETNDRHSSKLFKPRKASANLPLPSHSRTASSPSKLADLGAETSPSSKRHLGNIEQRSTDSDKSEKAPCKLENKKFSLDSHLSDKTAHHHEKHSKRSSGNCDKHQKRSLDDTRYSQASRTPSERSFTIGTPDKPKSLVASPELLAELLKGSSEKLVTEQLTGGASPNNNASNALPTAVLKCLDTRTHVVVELFNTEKSYVESLQTIVLKYLNQLKSPENAGLVDTQTVDEIFFMVPAILNIHERFLEELRRRLDAWDPMQKIGDAFVDVFSRPVILDTYTSFVNNWNRAKDAIRTTRQKCPAFARFLEAMAREHKGKLSLDNLLIKPVQKFPNYELILSRLIKHTDTDHPDQKPLQEALKLVHDILMFLNCKEKEALENGQRETALRELEGVIEGMNDLVTPDRAFLLFDLVSMPSGQATRKERGFFLFNDLLVITSIKRRSGTIRKTNMTCPGSVASTLDTNKYKFLTKISLDDLEIVKSKDENIRRIMKEIEHLSDDSNKLTQIFDLAASLRCPHQLLEESIRDLQREVQRQLSERQTNDAQLNILELMLNSSGGIQNMTVLFSKPDKRAQWEEAFTEAKQKLASALERCQIPEFVVSVPIRKTRAGLQFTCASPTLGIQRDVWVCNSDGYVGQVCVLSLVPEPTVTSCNGVCNARILCVASVPASDDSSSSPANASINISIQEPPTSVANAINSIVNSKPREKRKPTDGSSTESRNSCNIQLDSDSSSEDSETESQPERAVSPSNSTTATSSLTSSSLPISHRHQESNSEETDALQSTMWLGTEDGCIHVYNCTDNIRIKKNKIKIPHISAVYSILYLSNKVFVSLANGDVCIYSRDHNGWNTTSPFTVTVGTVTSPVTKLLNVHSKLWCAIQGCIKVLNTTTLQVDSQIQISNDSKPITNMTVLDEYVWISVQNSAHIKCCHHESYEIIFEVNLAPSVNKMLSNCDDIIRQHKAACLRVTSLLACKDLIWVGTSAGVLLTIAGSNISKGSSPPSVTGIPHGHTGHVRFLTFVESPQCDSSDDLSKLSDSKTDIVKTSTNRTLLVISGGDGYEDFRSSGNNTMSEIAGREDSTNHLLLWHV